MRETNQIVRQWCGQRKCWALAGVGCLIFLLIGCAPAVLLTRNYVDNREESGDPSRVYPVSSGQVPPDQTPLLTTRNYTEARAGNVQAYPGTLDQVWSAALAALNHLQVGVTSSVRDTAGGDIKGWWAGGKPLEMHVDQAGEGMITVKIRVGPLGDREAEDVIYAGISDTLRAKR